MKEENLVFTVGNLIRKKNWIPFSGTYPYIMVESHRSWANGFLLINEQYHLNPEHVVQISAAEAMEIDRIWSSCTLTEHVPVPGRNPCLRDDLQTSKQVLAEPAVQAKLFELRMKNKNSQFQAYRCPECQQIHIGKNPYVEK